MQLEQGKRGLKQDILHQRKSQSHQREMGVELRPLEHDDEAWKKKVFNKFTALVLQWLKNCYMITLYIFGGFGALFFTSFPFTSS